MQTENTTPQRLGSLPGVTAMWVVVGGLVFVVHALLLQVALHVCYREFRHTHVHLNLLRRGLQPKQQRG